MTNGNPKVVSAFAGAARLGKSAAFRLGYEDYIKGRAFQYDIPKKLDSIDYTRGRAFAVWCASNHAPRAVWRDGEAAKTVVDRIVLAIRSMYVI